MQWSTPGPGMTTLHRLSRRKPPTLVQLLSPSEMVCWYWFGAHPNHLTIVPALAAEMRAMPVTAVLKAFILFGGDRIGFVGGVWF